MQKVAVIFVFPFSTIKILHLFEVYDLMINDITNDNEIYDKWEQCMTEVNETKKKEKKKKYN